MERRLTRQGQERKADLIRHAAALFAERGYGQTRVIDIVRAAGVAKGLFYWYFDDKHALFRELIDENRRGLRAAQAAEIVGVDDPLAQIYLGAMASVRFMADHFRLYALVQVESTSDTRFAEAQRRTTEIHAADTAALVEAGQCAGRIRDDDTPRALAYGVLATVTYFVHFHGSGRLPGPPDAAAETAGRFVLHALAADSTIAAEIEHDHGRRARERVLLRGGR